MAFEEIKAKLGLDITAFEKGMLDANRAAKQAAAAQAKLADFRRTKALEEASDLGKVKILQGELVQLYNLRKTAVAGSAPYLQAQLEIEKKMVEIGKVRAQQKANEVQANQSIASSSGANLTAAMRSRSGSALSSAGSAAAGAGMMGALGGKTGKILEGIKSIGGALGASGAFAGLIPGFGKIAIAVGAIVYGLKKLKEYTVDVAARAQEIRDIMASMGKIRFERAFGAMTDKQKLKTLEDQVEQAEMTWKLSALVARNSKDDLDSVKAAQALETARNALADHRATMQEKAKQDAQAEADQVAAINKERSDALSEEMEKRHGVLFLQMSLAEAEKEVVKRGLTQLQRAEALVKIDQIRERLDAAIAANQKKAADATAEQAAKQAKLTEEEKERTEELKKQRFELEAQARLKAEDLRAARVQDVKPTMEEVTSGKRNIGGRAFRAATALEKERENSLRLADQVQRDAEALDAAKGLIDRPKAEATFNASRAALFESQQRIKRGQDILGNRVTDANPYATMEAELKSIKTELTTLNKTTLSPAAIK